MPLSTLSGAVLLAGMTLFYSLWTEDKPPDDPQDLVTRTWDDMQSGQRFLFHRDGIVEFHRWDIPASRWTNQGANDFTLAPGRVQIGSTTNCRFAWVTPGYIFQLAGDQCGPHGTWAGTYTRSEYRIGADGRMIAPWWDAD